MLWRGGGLFGQDGILGVGNLGEARLWVAGLIPMRTSYSIIERLVGSGFAPAAVSIAWT